MITLKDNLLKQYEKERNENKDYYEKEKVFLSRGAATVWMIWFIISLAASVVCMIYDDMIGWLLMIFGHMFIVIGTMFVLTEQRCCIEHKRKKKNKGSRILIVIGVFVIMVGIVMQWDIFNLRNADTLSFILKAITFITVVAFTCFAVFSAIEFITSMIACTEAYDAECIKILCKRVSNGNGKAASKLFCPVYRVYINDEVVELCNELYASFMIPKVGEKCRIYINKKKNVDFLDKRKIYSSIQNIIVGVMFALVAFYAMKG